MHHGDVSPQIAQGLLALRKRIAAAKIPSSQLDETINVAVWNIREFGKARRSEAAIHYIAEILGQFDLVSLVELRNALTDLGRVLPIRGPSWDVVYSDWMDDAGGNSERVAFLYDNRAVTFNGLAAEVDAPRDKQATEFLATHSFWRAPYMCSFRAGNFDFIAIAAHARWGDSIEGRQAELQMLADWIDTRFQSKFVEDHDLLVMGDFNTMITGIRLVLTAFVLVLAAGVGVAQTQQENQQAPAENARRIEVIQGEGHPWRVVDTIFRQPELEGQAVAACVIGEVHPASERFYVRLGNMGQEAAAATLAWDVGRHTGFRPTSGDSLVLYQRGPQPSGEGTAVQVRGREIGIWIDSDHPRPRIGALLPVCPAYWWWNQDHAPWPFREADRELSFSFDLKVPTAERQGQAEVYVCAHFLFRDQRSNRQFWFGASLFDLRGAERFPDTVHVDNWEDGTGLPILFSALNRRSAWLHPGPGSAQFTDRTFDDYRRFDFRVGATELRAAVVAMRKRLPKLADASEDPRDYQLVHFNVNPEVYAPEGSRGRLGLAMRDIRVVLLAP